MITTEVVREIGTLQEKLAYLTENLEKTSKMKLKLEEEYNSTKTDHEKEMLQLGKLGDSIVYKINKLETNIDDLKARIAEIRRDIGNYKNENHDMTFELPKLKSEMTDVKTTSPKKVEALKQKLREAKKELEMEKKLELEIEKTYEALRQKTTKELKAKLQTMTSPIVERYKKAKEKFQSKKESLLGQIHNLDDDINKIADEILLKTERIKALQQRSKALQKEFQKLSISRLISESEVTMIAVHKTLIYLHEHPESLTDDVILGVLIARANLKWIYTHPKSHLDRNSPLSENLSRLIMICENIIDSKKLHKTNTLSILNKNLWEKGAEDLKYESLNQENEEDFALPNFDSCQSIDEYLMRGTPEDSDFCINELFNSFCQVSEKCWLSEVNNMPHSGYKTSHRLIYLQAATKLQCQKINPRKFSAIRNLKKKLCQKMLLEIEALTKKPHFPLFRDLFMEHIALCGLEGYSEFASKRWRYQVRSWQSESGCFKFDEKFNCSLEKISKNDSLTRVKRTDTVIDSCHTHVTAVAVSALAFFVRFLINAVFLIY